MNLECLNGIITDNLAIHIDLTQLKSWDLNSGFTSISLTKWAGAVSENINLMDFGLTEFDNGRTNLMWSGITLTPADTLFHMYRIGYNEVENPTTGNTSGYTATTVHTGYDISGVTGASATTGNYFILNGGYLQGFFKAEGYNYELLPPRYNNGITIETLVYLYPDSQGIFYMMGARSEDKYNPYFSGETITGLTTVNTGFTPTIKQTFTGVTTSFGNYLNSFQKTEKLNKGFRDETLIYRTEYIQPPASANTTNNAIAFELTQDKHIAYKYINVKGQIITNTSVATITATGFTMIDIVFTPNETIIDPDIFLCASQRLGKMIFYVNGRAIWIIHDFPEFYFKSFNTDKEKQIGEPYSISWGGGSFGLKHSWHYDYQTYVLYNDQDTNYINNNFFVQADPIATDCYTPPTGNTYLSGLTLSADTTTFNVIDKCTGDEIPITVMRIEYTGITGTSASTYFVKFNHPITVLSNREYVVNLSLFNNGFFKQIDDSGNTINNRVSILVYGNVDVNIHQETQYVLPLTQAYIARLLGLGLHPFPDQQEYEYMLNGIMYFGVSGLPVALQYLILQGINIAGIPTQSFITGEDVWLPIKTVFSTEDNTGKSQVNIGLLIESDQTFNLNEPLFISNFTYRGADILVQDQRKNNLLIQQNFDSSFIGGIQKLRIYNNALTSPEVLHNAIVETKLNPNLNMLINKGGRIIHR